MNKRPHEKRYIVATDVGGTCTFADGVDVGGEIACMACGHGLAPNNGPWKQAAWLDEVPLRGAAGDAYSNAPNVMLRRFYCPECAILLDSESALEGDPYLNEVVRV